MKAEEYQSHTEDIAGWKVNVVTYRFGEKCYCRIDNVSPETRIACGEGLSCEEAERSARDDAIRRLQTHRRMEV